MKSTSTLSTTRATENELAVIFENLFDRLHQGEVLNIETLIAEHPQHAEELRRMLPTVTALAELGYTHTACGVGSEFLRLPDSALSSQSAIHNLQSQVTRGILGDFQILREIGRGGMGVVYEAEQISLRRRVALKVLPFAALLDGNAKARFENEARAAATLKHPNIVSIYGIGVERGVHHYSMELVEGQSLAEIVEGIRSAELGIPGSGQASNPPQPIPESEIDTSPLAALSTAHVTNRREYFRSVARLGIQAAQALDYAHEHGVTHRDVKPGNLMLDLDGRLLVTDFGLARIGTEPSLTMTGDLLGTLRYMSPEQALAKRAITDHRTDIYSLGVTLYELVALRAAFPGDDREKLLRRIVAENPQPPRQIDATIPRDLETVLLKAMAKDPIARYATANDFAEDLQRLIDLRPIVARRPSRLSKAANWSRRNPIVATLTSVVLILLTFLGIAGPMAAHRQRQLALSAIAQRDRARENLHRGLDLIELAIDPTSQSLMTPPDSERREARDRLLDGTIKFFESLDQEARTDPQVRRGLTRAYGTLGEVQFREGKDAKILARQAIDILTSLVNEYPENIDYLVGLAEAYGHLGSAHLADASYMASVIEYRNGAAHAREAIVRAPTHRYAHDQFVRLCGLYGFTLHKCGRSLEADAAFQAAFRDVRPVQRRGGESGGTFQQLAARFRYTSVLIDMSRYEEAARNLNIAHRLAEEILSSARNEGDSLFCRYWVATTEWRFGELDIIHGNADDALAHLEIALHLLDHKVPGNFWREDALGHTHFLRAVALTQLGRMEDAVSAYEEAQRYWRSTGVQIGANGAASSQARIGELYYALRRPNEGVEHLTAALRQFNETARSMPDEPNAHRPLIVFLCMCANPQLRDPERAVSVAERFISDNESNGLFWRYLGLARYRVGDWEEAEEAVRRGIQLRNGGDAIDLLLLAAIKYRGGDQDEARTVYEHANTALAAGGPVLYDEIDPYRFAQFRAEVAAVFDRPAERGSENP